MPSRSRRRASIVEAAILSERHALNFSSLISSEAPPTVKPAAEPAAAPPVAPKELLDEDAARAAAIQELREQMRPK